MGTIYKKTRAMMLKHIINLATVFSSSGKKATTLANLEKEIGSSITVCHIDNQDQHEAPLLEEIVSSTYKLVTFWHNALESAKEICGSHLGESIHSSFSKELFEKLGNISKMLFTKDNFAKNKNQDELIEIILELPSRINFKNHRLNTKKLELIIRDACNLAYYNYDIPPIKECIVKMNSSIQETDNNFVTRKIYVTAELLITKEFDFSNISIELNESSIEDELEKLAEYMHELINEPYMGYHLILKPSQSIISYSKSESDGANIRAGKNIYDNFGNRRRRA